MEEKQSLIFHYCSLDTFLSIIKYKTLRLSNITKSNDYLERSYILSNCEEIIYDCLKNHYEGCDDLSKKAYIEMIKVYINNHVDFYNQQPIISHAMCFSKDGDKLSQWRGYADDGRGIAIGFDRATLEKYLNKDKYVSLNDVVYEKNNKEFLIKELDIIFNLMKKDFIYDDARVEGIINIVCKELVVRLFLNKALIYKNPAFSEEDEVRIHTNIPLVEFGSLTNTHTDTFIEKLKKEITPLTVAYDFCAKSDKIVSFIDICFNPPVKDKYIPNELVKKIVIGSKANISIEELKHIMTTYKLGGCVTNISKSKSSYR